MRHFGSCGRWKWWWGFLYCSWDTLTIIISLDWNKNRVHITYIKASIISHSISHCFTATWCLDWSLPHSQNPLSDISMFKLASLAPYLRNWDNTLPYRLIFYCMNISFHFNFAVICRKLHFAWFQVFDLIFFDKLFLIVNKTGFLCIFATQSKNVFFIVHFNFAVVRKTVFRGILIPWFFDLDCETAKFSCFEIFMQ